MKNVFSFDFTSEFAADSLIVMRFSMRLVSDPKKLNLSIVTLTPAAMNDFCKHIYEDPDVLNAGAEYLATVETKNMFRIIAVKSAEDVAEEVN